MARICNQYKDHLEGGALKKGIVYLFSERASWRLGRLSYADANNNGSITQSEIVEETNYYPFGLKHKGYNNITNGGNASAQKNKTYQGQELDDEFGLNWYGFKYRNYDPATARFFNIDPLASKYEYNSTYAFQENKLGLGVELEGLELVYREGTDPKFKEKFAKSVKFMNKKGTSGMMAKLNALAIDGGFQIELVDNTGGGNSAFDPDTNTIYWDSELGAETSPGIFISPATILNHEIDHALNANENPKQAREGKAKPDKDYEDKEEKRVITGSEQKTAKKHGDIKKGQVTRKIHSLINITKVTDPTSNKGKVIENEQN